MLWNFNIICKKLLTYYGFNLKLAFFGYFEQSWKKFCNFAFNFIHFIAIVLIFEHWPRCVDSGGVFISICIIINKSKFSNKHTAKVEALCVDFLEQNKLWKFISICGGKRKISNNEFLNQCVLLLYWRLPAGGLLLILKSAFLIQYIDCCI